jgi:hypothetical protein
MNCQRCGTEPPEGARFCPRCGADLGGIAPVPTGAVRPRLAIPVWLVMGVVLLMLVGLGFGLESVFSAHDAERSATGFTPPIGSSDAEQALRSNLQILRNAIQHFQADTGVYPAKLEDLVAPTEKLLTSTVPVGTYKGPYLPPGGIVGNGIPKNPFTDPTAASIVAHWNYDADTGTVVVPDAQADNRTSDGTPFTQL